MLFCNGLNFKTLMEMDTSMPNRGKRFINKWIDHAALHVTMDFYI